MDGINFFYQGSGIKIWGEMGLRDQNNGKKIGINGSRIYHVTTLRRNGPWNDLFGSGNPAGDKSVKEYLHFITKEQAAANISSKQALPLFFDKLSKLIRHLISEAFSPSKVPPVQRYIFARDAAFFCVDFFFR